MDYTGVIIEESLKDKSILDTLKIVDTKVEPITPRHKTPWLTQWTLHTGEIPEGDAQKFAETLSKSFETSHASWYADFKNDKYHFIIYPHKIFQVDLQNPVLYKDASEYGITLGIPEYQVNFGV